MMNFNDHNRQFCRRCGHKCTAYGLRVRMISSNSIIGTYMFYDAVFDITVGEIPMQTVKLRKVGNSATVTLPASVVEALHLHENDEIAIEVAGDRVILTRASSDFQDAWEAYEQLEPRYRNANRKLAE